MYARSPSFKQAPRDVENERREKKKKKKRGNRNERGSLSSGPWLKSRKTSGKRLRERKKEKNGDYLRILFICETEAASGTCWDLVLTTMPQPKAITTTMLPVARLQ